MSDDLVCKKCSRLKSEHCEYEPIEVPEGCVCDPYDWGDPTNIPDVCEKFRPCEDENFSGMCAVCEHDEACHKR